MSDNVTYQSKPWLSSYETGVPESLDFEKLFLTDFLDRSVSRFPDNTALIFQGYKVSYRELDRMVRSMVASFREMSGREVSQISIGDVTPEERNGQIMFLYKEVAGEVPAGTDHVRIILRTKRYGGVSDSYADNRELILTEK